MKLTAGNLLINNIITVNIVVFMDIWPNGYHIDLVKKRKILGTYTFARIQKFKKILFCIVNQHQHEIIFVMY